LSLQNEVRIHQVSATQQSKLNKLTNVHFEIFLKNNGTKRLENIVFGIKNITNLLLPNKLTGKQSFF